MSLINVPDIEDGTGADGNDVNSRFATVLGLVNGNIDSTNIKTNGITGASIAAGSITNDKIVDTAINASKLDRNTIPWGVMLYADYGPTGGQVVNGDSTLNFTSLETNSHSGVAMNTNGVMGVSLAGVYSINFTVNVTDKSGSPTYIVWVETSPDGINWYATTPLQTDVVAATNRGTNTNAIRYLNANSFIRGHVSVGGGAVRFAGGDVSAKYMMSLATVRVA